MGCVNSKDKIYFPKPIKIKDKIKDKNDSNKINECKKFVNGLLEKSKETSLNENYNCDIEDYM